MVVFEIIAELCCSFLFYPAVEAARINQETKFVSINNNCSIDGCNAMRHEESIYCLRHKPSKKSKEETEQEKDGWVGYRSPSDFVEEENWWEDEKE